MFIAKRIKKLKNKKLNFIIELKFYKYEDFKGRYFRIRESIL